MIFLSCYWIYLIYKYKEKSRNLHNQPYFKLSFSLYAYFGKVRRAMKNQDRGIVGIVKIKDYTAFLLYSFCRNYYIFIKVILYELNSNFLKSAFQV